MDAELLALQKLFAEAQEVKSTVRLSERNVVELVTKLQHLKLLDSNLLHTVSGKEYLTQEQLRSEVSAEVKRLGRVSLVELAATLGVDLYHIEKQAEQVVLSNDDLSLIQGEILSSSFWDNLAGEVNDTLQEAGHIPLADLAKRYSVGAELLSAALESRLGKLIDGKLEGGQLYTPAFVSRVQAIVRGAVRALTVPTPLSDILTSVQQLLRQGDRAVGGALGEGGLFHSVLNSLVANEAILGTLRGGGASWTPLVFTQSQRHSIEAFFSQNGYIGFDVLRKLSVPHPKPYMQANYPEGIALDSVFIHPSFINIIDAAAEEAVIGGGWFDALSLLPSSFGTADTTKLVSYCPSVLKAKKEADAEIYAETCVVSSRFVKGLLEKFEAELRKSAHLKLAASQSSAEVVDSASQRNQLIDSASPAAEHGVDLQNEKSGRRKRGKAAQVLPKSKGASDTMVEEGGKGSKSRKKGRADALDRSTAGAGRSLKEEEGLVPSVEQLADNILEWYPDMESAGAADYSDAGSLPSILAALLRPALVSSWLAMKNAIFSSRADDRRRRLDTLQQKIGEVYANLQLYTKAVELFEDDKVVSVLLQRHLLRTVASEIVDMFLYTQVMENRLDKGLVVEVADGVSPPEPFSVAQRLSKAKTLAVSSLSKAATSMVETLEGKDLGPFDAALEEVMKESGLRLTKIDKKGERALLHSHRKVLQLQVEEETDPVALLPKVVGLLFIQLHYKALQAPGRALTAAITHLEKSMSNGSFQVLQEYHAATVAILSSLSREEGMENSDDLGTERNTLKYKMADLKALVQTSNGKS